MQLAALRGASNGDSRPGGRRPRPFALCCVEMQLPIHPLLGLGAPVSDVGHARAAHRSPPVRRGWEVPLPLCCARRSASPAAYRAGWLAGGTTNTGARGPRAVRFPRRMDPASAGRWPANHPAPHHDHWRRATSGPARDSAKPIAALSWISFRWQGTGTFSRRGGRCCRRAPHRARPCSPARRGCPRPHG